MALLANNPIFQVHILLEVRKTPNNNAFLAAYRVDYHVRIEPTSARICLSQMGNKKVQK